MNANEWQPIETAPKDGTRIRVKFANETTGEANWQTTYGGEWHVKSFTHLPWADAPIHWMSLPQPEAQP